VPDVWAALQRTPIVFVTFAEHMELVRVYVKRKARPGAPAREKKPTAPRGRPRTPRLGESGDRRTRLRRARAPNDSRKKAITGATKGSTRIKYWGKAPSWWDLGPSTPSGFGALYARPPGRRPGLEMSAKESTGSFEGLRPPAGGFTPSFAPVAGPWPINPTY
jgi:hypothetical protein